MILGFAHLTIGAQDAAAAEPAWIERGWSRKFHERDAPSASAKLPLLQGAAAKHDLIFLSGAPSVELVAHDSGVAKGPSKLALGEDGALRVIARAPADEAAFLTAGLGMVEEEGALHLRSRFPQWSLKLRVEEDAQAPLDPPLDLEGPNCLAFYTTDIEGDRDRLLAAGGRDATEIFALTVDGRNLSILMLRSPEGTIFELIQVRSSG